MRRLKYQKCRRPKEQLALGVELMRVRRGRSTFDEFVRATLDEWQRVAVYLRNRWSVPEAVEPRDVMQEMLLAAWVAVDAWEPSRGVTLRNYVMWKGITAGKKFLHRQRAALRRDGCAPSRHDVAESTLPALSSVSKLAGAAVEPEQECAVYGTELLARFAAGATLRDAVCVDALVCTAGDVVAAAGLLYSNTAARVAFRFDSEADARRALVRAATRIANHVAGDTAAACV